jgi:hypothetical protein
MSDEITTTEPTVEPVVTEEPQGAPVETDWKAEARKWENRAKAAKADSEDATKWREYEAAQKPIQERIAEELAQTKAAAAEAAAKLLRYEVAAAKGITGEATKLLKGSTPEELEAEADLLLSLIASQSKPKTPLPDENQGKPAPSSVGQLTKEDLKSMTPTEINEAKAAGRLNDILGIH